jgi:hypothetical protein
MAHLIPRVESGTSVAPVLVDAAIPILASQSDRYADDTSDNASLPTVFGAAAVAGFALALRATNGPGRSIAIGPSDEARDNRRRVALPSWSRAERAAAEPMIGWAERRGAEPTRQSQGEETRTQFDLECAGVIGRRSPGGGRPAPARRRLGVIRPTPRVGPRARPAPVASRARPSPPRPPAPRPPRRRSSRRSTAGS